MPSIYHFRLAKGMPSAAGYRTEAKSNLRTANEWR